MWFATIGRNRPATGIFADTAICYPPAESPECFVHAKAVVLTLAGNRPEPGNAAYTNAKTEVIEDSTEGGT